MLAKHLVTVVIRNVDTVGSGHWRFPGELCCLLSCVDRGGIAEETPEEVQIGLSIFLSIQRVNSG